jgi:hypothetical protein
LSQWEGQTEVIVNPEKKRGGASKVVDVGAHQCVVVSVIGVSQSTGVTIDDKDFGRRSYRQTFLVG